MSSIEATEMEEISVLLFYGWWQLTVCLFAFLGLMSIWWHLGRKQGDFGQVWLALSILSWSVSGGFEVFFVTNGGMSGSLVNGTRSIFSLFNSLFILLGLPWFRYLPKFWKPIIQSKYWIIVVGLPFLFSLLPTISRMISGQKYVFVSELDVYYSVLTLIFLGFVFWESFLRRRLKMLAWLSLVCIITTLIAQGYKLTGSNINMTLFSAIFKTTLIMLFFALALSWVKDLTLNVIPKANSMMLSLAQRKNLEDKMEYLVNLQGIPGKNGPLVLTQGMFTLFLKFCTKRLDGSDWLNIKPKNDPRKEQQYDINDHNEIKRLNAALLDGLFGKNQWTKEHHEIPLKEELFVFSEKRERKIRLAIPAENIAISKELRTD